MKYFNDVIELTSFLPRDLTQSTISINIINYQNKVNKGKYKYKEKCQYKIVYFFIQLYVRVLLRIILTKFKKVYRQFKIHKKEAFLSNYHFIPYKGKSNGKFLLKKFIFVSF